MSRKSKILISCAPRNQNILAQELRDLGYQPDRIERLSVTTSGTFEDTFFLNLHLRTAHRVLYMVGGFKAHKPELLYQELVKIPWEKFIFPDGYIHIASSVRNDFIRDTRFANLKVKDAIVDRMMKKTGQRPDSGKDNSKACLFLFWHLDNCAIYLDTSGDSIARHGYRKMPHKAPLQESLAAAIVKSTKWNGQQPLVNPMCGSGTLAIESALIALNKPPGLLRDNFSFMHFKTFQKDIWIRMKKRASENILDQASAKIIATDRDKNAIKAAQTNARNAGVAHMIEWSVCDFRETPIPSEEGVLIMNPEYGERLGETDKLRELYPQIGDFMKKNCQGYTGYVFTGNLDLAKTIGLRPSRRIEFFNAKIDCRLLEYDLYKGTKR